MDSQTIPIERKLPRSTKPPATKAEVIRRRTLGETISNISVQLGISEGTVRTIIAESETESKARVSPEQIFAQVGLTPEVVAKKFLELNNAKDVRLASFEGKFTDRVEVEDTTVQFRSNEAVAKILGMFPREDATVAAQLFVRLPDVTLAPGHPSTCTCSDCLRAWESLPVAPVLPELP